MIVGISGHQKLGAPGTVAWIQSIIFNELSQLKTFSGISALAAGADQLFANIVINLHSPLDIVVPCQGYEATFGTSDALLEFNKIKLLARNTHILPFEKPSENAFWQAGMYIVNHCNLMIFVWDGQPAKGLGGTADVFKYAEKNQKPYLHINPISLSIVRSPLSSHQT